MTHWRRQAPGVYDSADGRFQLTHICYWELIDTGIKAEGDGLGPPLFVADGSGEFASKKAAQDYVATLPNVPVPAPLSLTDRSDGDGGLPRCSVSEP